MGSKTNKMENIFKQINENTTAQINLIKTRLAELTQNENSTLPNSFRPSKSPKELREEMPSRKLSESMMNIRGERKGLFSDLNHWAK